MHTFRFYKSRSDLSVILAEQTDNLSLREKYLQLARDWAAKADRAPDAPGRIARA